MGQLELAHLQKRYGSTLAVADVSLTIAPGEWVTFLGPSGSGKTTTLRMIAGFIQPTVGSIQLDGEILTSVADRIFIPPERRHMGMVFQSYAVWPHMTIFKNVAYPLKFTGLDPAEQQTRVGKILDLVQLSHLSNRFPAQLSGGQQQRVALARSLVMEPKLLLLDEPLSNLDAKLRDELRAEIVDLTRCLGATVIYVTHDQTEALAMSDRVVVMHHGQIQQVDTPQVIYQTPVNSFVATFVGSANLLPGRVLDFRGEWMVVEIVLNSPVVLKVLNLQGAHLAIDQQVTVMIRPENIQLKRRGDSEITATILQRSYLGHRVIYQAQVGSEKLQVSTSVNQFQVGDSVSLGVQDPVIVPDAS